jgi:hypothetical protein
MKNIISLHERGGEYNFKIDKATLLSNLLIYPKNHFEKSLLLDKLPFYVSSGQIDTI